MFTYGNMRVVNEVEVTLVLHLITYCLFTQLANCVGWNRNAPLNNKYKENSVVSRQAACRRRRASAIDGRRDKVLSRRSSLAR